MPSFSSYLNRYPAIIFILLSLLLSLSRAWEGVLDGDSMWYTIMAKEVVESGNWSILYYRGVPFFDHPPLGIWLIAIIFKIFGVSIYVAKLMNALALFGITFFVYKIGRILKDENVGIIAAIIFLLIPHIIQMTGRVKLDMPLIFFSTLAMYGAISGAAISRWFYLLLGIGTAGAVLTKGIVGFAPVPISVISLLLLKKWRDLVSVQFLIGLSLILLIPLPWIISVLSKEGVAPFIIYWKFNVQKAVMHGRWEDDLPGFWYFAKIIFTRGIPWTWISLITILLLIKRWIKSGFDHSLFLVCWVVIVYLGYSIPKSKFAYYIAPIYPPIAILAGFYLSRFFSKNLVIKYSYVACILIAFIISVFPIPLRLERSQGVSALLPSIAREYEVHKDLKIAVIDVHSTVENNTYQLIALNIDPKIEVKLISKSAWKSIIRPESENNYNLVLIPKKSVDGFKRSLNKLQEIAFNNEYALFARPLEMR